MKNPDICLGFFIPMKFKIILPWLTIANILLSCTASENNYSVADCLPSEKQQQILKQMVRYANKLAPEATHATKFNPEFNWYYERAINESKILYCNKVEHDVYQLMVARKARSINPMEEGIAIKVKLDHKDNLIYYEEVFRMWKMPTDTLMKRGKYLFNRMVNNEDLTIYYSKFQKDKFIEFPDQRFSFDVAKRRWRDSALDTINFD
jgi:hypothetical protein